MQFRRCDQCDTEIGLMNGGGAKYHRVKVGKLNASVDVRVMNGGSTAAIDLCDACLFDVLESWALSARAARFQLRQQGAEA